MTKEERQLLLKDLCARLPYGVICRLSTADVSATEELDLGGLEHFIFGNVDVKPYLRPMSSMTEEEELDFILKCDSVLRMTEKNHTCILSINEIDWLLSHHFDYRGLIEKGLALESPEDMYNI